jgi:uncharacterized protein YprB with RNaseH-like and TPR domain/predicted nuclease with RNAse H fold
MIKSPPRSDEVNTRGRGHDVTARRPSSDQEDGLLAETFVHISGIGSKTERRLWETGVSSWEDLKTTSFGLRPQVLSALEKSTEALASDDVDFFFSSLPARDRWRTFADFGEQFIAVDIETTGMSIYDQITVIGIEQGGEYRTFIQGSNLADAAELLHDASGLITFNGSLFDLPFLKRVFPEVELPAAHVDLRFLSRRIGLAGSLKSVERQAELRREVELDDISGYGATVLWSYFDHDRDLSSLERLVLYNAADTCVLRPLAELVTDRLLADLHLDLDENAAPTLFQAGRGRPARSADPAPRLAPLPEVRHTSRSICVGAVKVKLPPRRRIEPRVTLTGLHQRMADPYARIVGIDLTGSEARPTGWALLEGTLVVSGMLHTDEEILSRTLACRPRIVSIDSPLSLPTGRDCTSDDCSCRAVGGITRHCERELKRRGVNVYPCLIQSMQRLTERGTRLAEALRAAGVEVIESYPGAAQDIMRIPRKKASQERLRSGLSRFGLRGIRREGELTHDELDAITSAAVGAFYLADTYEALGTPDEDYLIIPSAGEDEQPGPPPGPVDRDVEPLSLVVVGPGAQGVVDRQRKPLRDLPVLESSDEFLRHLANYGARARGFYIGPEGVRLSYRPSLFDDQRRIDSEDLPEALAAWAGEWRT